jgi:hypothetical protein
MAAVIFLLNVPTPPGNSCSATRAGRRLPRRVWTKPPAKSSSATFYSDFYGYVNLLGFLLQTFVTSRIFKFIGVRGAMFLLPVIAFGAYGLLLVYPVLAVVRFAKILENATTTRS